jgi:flagellar hook-associated protein 1 FlgK
MPGLFDTLHLGARSLQAQQHGIEVAGHNLANANNPAYARQRVNLATSITIATPIGLVGTGVEVVSIQQLRDALLDGQITSETSVRGFLEASQRALQFGQSVLAQRIDRQVSGTESSSAAQGVGSQYGIAEGLSGLFSAFQSLSTDPTSLSERQSVVAAGDSLAANLRQIDAQLEQLTDSLNESLQADVAKVNELLGRIANYNKEILRVETGGKATANDLRDLRQQRIEELAKLANVQTTAQSNGTMDIAIAGVTLVSGVRVTDTLAAYDPGGGRWMVQTATGGSPLALTSGSIQGTIETRDGALRSLRDDLNALATSLITEVNAIHRLGYSLTGSTGADLFTGTNAGDIAVDASLVVDPSRLQVSGVAGAVGDNQTALALAQLADRQHASLSNQTFSEYYSRTVANLGQSLASTNNALTDQDAVEQMLLRQRDAISGVSLDEEMTDLIKFQRAYEASAKLIATVDEMLSTLVNMKR